jgi:hypothetical protein
MLEEQEAADIAEQRGSDVNAKAVSAAESSDFEMVAI